MPNIENLATKNFSKNHLLQARRNEIIYREDLRTGFFYALTGIVISLAVAGGIYVIGKKLLA